MTNNSHSLQNTALHAAPLDPFEVALAALGSVGIGFEVISEVDSIGTGPDRYEHAA